MSDAGRLVPLPETEEALDEYLDEDDGNLRETLLELGRRAVALVPSCVGLSLGLVHDDLTFTLVATSDEVATIDAAQYLDGGPCVEVASGTGTLDVEIQDLLDEGRWSAFARSSAAHGVKSSLSLPLVRQGRLVGGINLYAASPHAFVGKHEALADALGATAAGAVADADLGFTSRARAVATPATLDDQRTVDIAVGVLAARDHTDVETARATLERAARRAGVDLVQAARVISGLRPA
jgi:GAF domain-containing protein